MDLTRFSLATFNLYNLQLADLPMRPRQRVWTAQEYERKISWVGAVLADLQADVIGLQELWHAQAMTDALSRAGLVEHYDLLAKPAVGDSIVCAALVRRGLLRGEPQWISAFPAALRLESSTDDPQAPSIFVGIRGFSRPVLRFEVALRGEAPLTSVYVAHFKSKLPTEVFREPWYRGNVALYRDHQVSIGSALSTIRRTAEATALRILLTQELRQTSTPVIVLGDLNDGQHSNTVNILTGQPSYLVGGSTGGADAGLYTAQTLQEYRDSRDVYYTHIHQDLRESLDHILVSEQFYDNSRRRVWTFDGLAITNDHLNDADPARHRTNGTGDHGVVAARFRYHPAIAA